MPVIDSYIKQLFHLNETDGAFTDSSSLAATVTNTGVTYDATGKFNGCASFGGDGDRLSVPYNAAYNAGTGDFTWGTWYKTDTINNSRLWGQNVKGSPCIDIYATGLIYLGTANVGYQSNANLTAATVANGNFHYIEICRVSGTVYISLDGTQKSVTGSSNTTDYTFSNSSGIYIGAANSGTIPIVGYLDEMEYSVGIGRHTENFTPYSSEWAAGHPAIKRFGGVPYAALNRGVF